jgi:hypothetical protein
MENSKHSFENNYLKSIIIKQDRNRPMTVIETDTPYHFRQKEMNPYERNEAIQLKIIENPDLYMHTHIKCSVCNKYVPTDQVDHHSFVHLEEEEKIDRILSQRRVV